MTKEKEPRVLLICESPNKVPTISKILKELGYTNTFVVASVGHISKIADSGLYNMGIDPKNDFKADYMISPDKQEIFSKLKEQVKVADKVILASDQDREGEVIAWSLKHFLKIPESKYSRIVYHEITKNAIKNALENERKIDNDLVAAGTTRSKLDKIVGYRLSGIARNNVGARSVGRCQSAGLKLIVDREKEILNFKPEKYFDLYLHFKKNKVDFKAKYIGTDKKDMKSLSSLDECKKVVGECKNNPYVILNIDKKDSLEYPKLPFTTSTFQQEVNKKLGISVNQAMSYAQKLFEGINVNGEHIALTTYLRTDDSDIDPTFIPVLEEFVKKTYGDEYYAVPRKGKKSDNAQEGHECFRVLNLELTPEKLSKYISDDKLLKIYSIIYKRTVAAAMKPAVIANTNYLIDNNKHRFIMTSKELRFDGYRKVYSYVQDDDNSEDQIIKETFNENEVLKDTSLEAIEKETKPAARFNEASFIKELDKQGIGRPSTYATIVSVLLDTKRGYCKVEDKNIVPTELGMKLSDFLDKSFSDIINIKYTAKLEKDLDLIAKGSLDYISFLTTFYNNLEDNIKKVEPETKMCPECGAPMKIRRGKFSPFYGCSKYPECKYTESIKK